VVGDVRIGPAPLGVPNQRETSWLHRSANLPRTCGHNDGLAARPATPRPAIGDRRTVHCARPSARARATRATSRARRSGSGVRARAMHASTTCTATAVSVRQAACTATGRASRRVRTHAPTIAPSSVRGATSPGFGPGLPPRAPRGRWVTPTVGTSSTAPRCRARPAPRGWSRPVASTRSTSGRVHSAATAAARAGPSRSASRPGWYDAPATEATTASSTRRRLGNSSVAAPAQPRSPRCPGPC
jgi:hypothetical protein